MCLGLIALQDFEFLDFFNPPLDLLSLFRDCQTCGRFRSGEPRDVGLSFRGQLVLEVKGHVERYFKRRFGKTRCLRCRRKAFNDSRIAMSQHLDETGPWRARKNRVIDPKGCTREDSFGK